MCFNILSTRSECNFHVFYTRFECNFPIFSTRFECRLLLRWDLTSQLLPPGVTFNKWYANFKCYVYALIPEGREKNGYYTRNEWRRFKITLEASGEDSKSHSKRVENMYLKSFHTKCKQGPKLSFVLSKFQVPSHRL